MSNFVNNSRIKENNDRKNMVRNDNFEFDMCYINEQNF